MVASDPEDKAAIASNRGELASIYGDTQTSILLFQRAVAENPTPLNKFNLAGAYRNAGRIGEALITYDQVVKEGANSEATTLAPRDERDQRNVKFNLATRARVGVQDMLAAARSAPTASTGDEKPEMTPVEAAAADRLVNP